MIYSKTLQAYKAQKEFERKEKVFIYASLFNLLIVIVYLIIQ